jgi:hypothetical protein
MVYESSSVIARPNEIEGRCLIIVARHETDLWHYMKRHYAQFRDMQVLLDRRREERRQRVQTYPSDRRGPDRRHPASIDEDLRRHPFVIICQQMGPLGDRLPDPGWVPPDVRRTP